MLGSCGLCQMALPVRKIFLKRLRNLSPGSHPDILFLGDVVNKVSQRRKSPWSAHCTVIVKEELFIR
jgi:hypothetical protein